MKKELACREIKNIYHELGGILGHRYMHIFLSRKNMALSKTTVRMSKAGCPHDSAPMERYYNTFKNELIKRFHFHTDEELNRAISVNAYVWYNQFRPHSYSDYIILPKYPRYSSKHKKRAPKPFSKS